MNFQLKEGAIAKALTAIDSGVERPRFAAVIEWRNGPGCIVYYSDGRTEEYENQVHAMPELEHFLRSHDDEVYALRDRK